MYLRNFVILKDFPFLLDILVVDTCELCTYSSLETFGCNSNVATNHRIISVKENIIKIKECIMVTVAYILFMLRPDIQILTLYSVCTSTHVFIPVFIPVNNQCWIIYTYVIQSICMKMAKIITDIITILLKLSHLSSD